MNLPPLPKLKWECFCTKCGKSWIVDEKPTAPECMCGYMPLVMECDKYTADQIRQAQREAVAADHAQWAEYLKEGQTPFERFKQERKDLDALMARYGVAVAIGIPEGYKLVREAVAAAVPEWIPVTQDLVNEQHDWLYKPCWIATKNGQVCIGFYEWRQGWDPDRFHLDGGGDIHISEATHIMTMQRPTAPEVKP
jgi:hypothetical protein